MPPPPAVAALSGRPSEASVPGLGYYDATPGRPLPGPPVGQARAGMTIDNSVKQQFLHLRVLQLLTFRSN